jgi:outer membrane protein OmpA-like peptidoglycan-associated protein
MTQRLPPFSYLIACLAIFIISVSSNAVAADAANHRQLFSVMDGKFKTAKAEHVNVLAPEGYEKAVKYYKSAQRRFNQNRGQDDIRKDLAQSNSALRGASEAAQIAAVPFAAVIVARTNAKSANAAQYAAEAWETAEEEFRDAAARLEGGNIKGAREAAKEISALFQTSELAAIKSNYLSGARNLIKQAEELRADKYANKTLIDAKHLLADAERELTENRYDTDYPRDLARRARNEAKHAITITKLAIGVKKKDFSVEDIITNYEKPLAAIAGELNLVASLHDGYDETEEEILVSVRALQRQSAELTQSLLLNEERALEIASLSAQLGIKSEKLAEEARFKALLANIENIFDAEEAQIFRQNKNMIIRMIGLNFDSNKTVLKPNHLVMLNKVQQAIELSQSDKITIEGHTDSYGSDASNLTLSEQRAAAVVQHLLNTMELDSAKISSVGYGETRPIANNETPEGRAKNRRIDVVIQLAK